MKIGILKEREHGERRVAATPDAVKQFVSAGYDVTIEKNSGEASGFSDQEYMDAGSKISSIPLEIISDADIILKVKPTPLSDKISEHDFAKENAILISFINMFTYEDVIKHYNSRNLSVLSMDLVPRSSKAQSMDALSSQANLSGYKAVIEAANLYEKSFPMFMTAAGTLSPAKVLVLGAGVAGLQAIATAKRLGAIVYAYDVRAAAKEQVESLGGRFIHPSISQDFSADGGYAKEVTEDFAKLQESMLLSEFPKMDIVISTAQIPGRKAPILITKDMVSSMPSGSIIVDIATATGGNCELSVKDSVIEFNKVKIIGYSNLPSKIANDSSKLYAKNILNLIKYLDLKNSGKLETEDDIVNSMIICHNGSILKN